MTIRTLVPALIAIAALMLWQKCAGGVDVEWDASLDSRAEGYEVEYWASPPFAPVVVDVKTALTAKIPLDVGSCRVRAYMFLGSAKLRSEWTEALDWDASPLSPPAGLRVIEIEASADLGTWEPVAWLPIGDKSARFVRANIRTIP